MTRSTSDPTPRQLPHPDPNYSLQSNCLKTRVSTAERMGRALGPTAPHCAFFLVTALRGEESPPAQTAMLAALTRLALLGGEALYAVGQAVQVTSHLLADTEDAAVAYECNHLLDTICEQHNRAVVLANAARVELRRVTFGLPIQMRDHFRRRMRKGVLSFKLRATAVMEQMREAYSQTY